MSHLNKFYETFDGVKNRYFDGLIITGAPVEQMEFEEVDYWKEMCDIFEWTKTHVTSTMHLCWGAQAGLYYHYGLKKHLLDKKVFGVFEHHVMNRKVPLVRGFDDYFMAPHSRHTEVRAEDIRKIPDLTILAESDEAGVFLAIADEGRRIFVMGHPEYDRVTLDKEYKRCLLYTSDAADEEDSVNLGGRRHIKKKKKARQRTKGIANMKKYNEERRPQ